MFTHPYIASQFDRVRHRETLARVRQQRMERRLRGLSSKSWCAEGTDHRQRRAWRFAPRLHPRALA